MGGREWNTHKKTQRIFKIFKMMSIFFFFAESFLFHWVENWTKDMCWCFICFERTGVPSSLCTHEEFQRWVYTYIYPCN